jgi:D-alanine-D-alanine ligase
VVEEFLPGDEYTVLMVGNGGRREFLAGQIHLADPSKGSPHGILRADMRGVGLTKIRKAEADRAAEAAELCRQACDALGCLDHVRTDMRVDAAGRLKIMEVNGIPGLKPIKSWSPQIYSLFHPSPGGPAEEYRRLIDQIVGSALERFGR